MRSFSSFAAACACLASVGGGFVSSVAAAPAGPVQIAASEKPKIVATLHAKNLEVTLGLVRDYLPVPFKPEVALFEMFGELAGQVLLSTPISLVVGVDGAAQTGDDPAPPLLAFSVGVRSLDEVQKRAQGRGMISGGKPGASLLQIQSGGRALFCLLTPGSIAGSGRLSCARKENERDVLAPYLSRLTPPSQNSDLHGEIFVDSLVAAYETPWQRLLQIVSLVAPQKLKLGNPAFDRALTDVLQALVGQLQAMSRDVQNVAVDLTLQKTGIELRLAQRLIGQTSWWAQSESDPSSPGGAPPMFFSLPGDSMAASFQQSDPRWAKQILDLIVPLLDGYLSHDGMAAADRQAISDVVNKAMGLSKGKPLQTVMATGKGPDQVVAVDGGFDPMAILSGNYYLVATEGANEQTVPWLKSIVAMYNRPGVQSYLRAKWKTLDPSGAPPTLKADALPKGLPAGGYAMVLSGSFSALSRVASPGRPVAKARPLVLHLITAPGNGRLWSALGADKAALGQRLVEAMGQPVKTVAQKGGIEALRDPGLRGGGFTSLVAMSSYLDALILATSRKGGTASAPRVSASQLFTLSPHHGEVPMIYLSRRGAAEGSGRTTEFIVRVPRLVIEDIAALAMQIALEK